MTNHFLLAAQPDCVSYPALAPRRLQYTRCVFYKPLGLLKQLGHAFREGCVASARSMAATRDTERG